jgi:hypothetical protein
MQSAVNPLLVLAKQHFKPEAGPILGEMWFRFSVEDRCDPEVGESASMCGPETGMLGLDHVSPVDSGLDFREGGPPMMPPSTNFTDGAVVSKRAAISRAERGEIAFRSK